MGQVVSPKVCDPQSDESRDTLIKLAIPYAMYTERDARYLMDKVDRLARAGTWPHRLEGEPKTWERFCIEVLGYDSRYFDAIREGIVILEARGIDRPTVGQSLNAGQKAALATTGKVLPSDGYVAERVVREAATSHDDKRKGRQIADPNSQRQRSARNDISERTQRKLDCLAKDFPALHARVKAGELSVNAAALEAGLVAPTMTIPLDPVKAARRIAGRFAGADLDTLIEALQDVQAGRSHGAPAETIETEEIR